MTDLIGNEEELILLRQENQALRERADVLEKTTHVLEETISMLREQIDLKDQLIATSQLEKAGYGNLMSSSSVRFSRPPMSLRKKSSKRRG